MVMGLRRFLVVVAGLLLGLVVAGGAGAVSSVGFDISYPQCGAAFPSGGGFGIVGVNGGLPFSPNPCLGTGDGLSELAWAGLNAGLYANTADPGPLLSSHWPNGQTSPKQCNTAGNPGMDTPECHYDYGWNAAADSYRDAVTAYIALGWAPAGSTRTPVANDWWLDVETANSWTSSPSSNVQALQGEADYLASVGAAAIGFYSTGSQWQTITGSTGVFAADPSWLAGASSLADAESRCGAAGFTGGGVALVQFVSGFDNDFSCAVQPALAFSTAAQTLTAGLTSAPVTVQLPQPSLVALSVLVSSSSSAGSFSTNPTGPWTTTLPLPIAAGASATQAFYYQDTKAGSPALTATASGYANATQTETVSAAALAHLTISPSTVQTRVGLKVNLTATGTDSYGNPVAVTPTWSVTPPSLGSFQPPAAATTSFTSTTSGSGTITATTGPITANAPISISRRRHG
jgi:hypothetical protein